MKQRLFFLFVAVTLFSLRAFALGGQELVDALAGVALSAAEEAKKGIPDDQLAFVVRNKLDEVAKPIVQEMASQSREGLKHIARLLWVGSRPGTPTTAITGINTLARNFRAKYIANHVTVGLIQQFGSKCTGAFLRQLAQTSNKTQVAKRAATLLDDAIRPLAAEAAKQFDDAVNVALKAIGGKTLDAGSGKNVIDLVRGFSRTVVTRTGAAIGPAVSTSLSRGGGRLGGLLGLAAGPLIDTLLSPSELGASEITFPGEYECIDRLARLQSDMVGFITNTLLQIEALKELRQCYRPIPPATTLDDLFSFNPANYTHFRTVCSATQISALEHLAGDYGREAESLSYSIQGPMRWGEQCMNMYDDPNDTLRVTADLNFDGEIDAADAGTAFSNDSIADLNFDGVVDAADFGHLFAVFGQTNLLHPSLATPSVLPDTLELAISQLENSDRYRGCNLEDQACFPEAESGTRFHDYWERETFDIATYE